MNVLFGLIGVIALLLCAVLLSESRQSINWKTVSRALLLQVAFAALVLYFPWGQAALTSLSSGVSSLLGFADQGIAFLFGDLANTGFIFAVRVLPIIIFFSALISALYYLGIMQKVIEFIGGGIQKFLGTSKAESLVATGNIFLSQGESPLLVRPFLSRMTRSELFAVMAGGMASVAGSVLGGYAGLGVELKYLIAASFMAAPGSLMMAKIIVPERDTPIDQSNIEMDQAQESNVIDALASGAMNGMKVAVAVGTMLIAFVSVIAMVNTGLESLGEVVGFSGVTLQALFGYLFSPLAWVIGVPSNEVLMAGSYIGQKIVMNEFVAFIDFVEHKALLSEHSQVIITFALCGFANIGSIAIQLGSIGVIAPERRAEVANLGIKAVLAGTLANLMSACLAGIFILL
ncbi:NupC/NupG family nucleoside CNT transporter [Vibrio brasiliensis]|jgi:CNT family concentrative nucleoside transporter|uniref:Nucleoside permease n=1 Tax=Vibrio brasiliensis LMG 20546 TaxID=945543 RepID=E8LZ04_9VIBR|nr:NupC/NupG family nucleoside CNT transporter [Vibrio brasiliensis]EGA63990.1 nucleoside permease NupC [Vibrio brasiliensis LMG 20546]MCG9648062.1 NupC/NupG family nucleoside CNT transporter [Vibrio brasiliensis]MCG9726820.1 NupC/NupG family nucleoside CNT transporter [Vibrio brasiliensis]MCG9751277.1 NupC/NupG family nucleoside CNT transporter [Vibrio brasiliensis]MCG9781548.1 NupC/NupG family nucleoside CNT transporter [Vibrio brasiliensis]